jgi:hypothetical protein
VSPLSTARPVTALQTPWYADPIQIAELWSWLDDECWPSDGGRRPNVSTFIAEAHRWSDDRERMLAEERAA